MEPLMELLTGKDAATRIAGMISPKYQVHGYAVDLTVKNIYAVDPVGQVDFGGSEYRGAERIPIVAQSRRAEDKYRWWDLSRGAYFVEFNEALELAANEFALLEPAERLLRAGAGHGSVTLRGHVAPVEMLLDVDSHRIQIKQNARISQVRLFRFVSAAPETAPLSKTITVKATKPSRKGKKRK